MPGLASAAARRTPGHLLAAEAVWDGAVMLQGCLNGARLPEEHPRLPVSPQQLAEDARAAVAAGCEDLHVHPKNGNGHDTLHPDLVGATLTAVRAAVPDTPVGVTTGAWAGDASARIASISAWTVLPDHASVNFHEPGAADVAWALLERGIGVDAGLWTGTDGLQRLLASGLIDSCRLLLVEATESDPVAATRASHAVMSALPPPRPVLLHGENETAWPLLQLALKLGLHTRIGLEDVLVLPSGAITSGNRQLFETAKQLSP